MTIYPLSGPVHLHPVWFAATRSGKHSGYVAADGTIAILDVPLTLREPGLPPGTEVRVWLNQSGHFVCATAADLDAAAHRASEAAERDDQQRRARLDALRHEAESVNGGLHVPVRWEVGIKDVLSGLSETSMGHGRNKATVNHVLLLGPLHAGRLTRHAGDFLCSSNPRKNGKRWSGASEAARCIDGNGDLYAPRITCKSCLKIAERLKR